MERKNLQYYFFVLCWLFINVECGGSMKLEQKAEEKSLRLHHVDSVNLMLFTLLLVLTVLTIWFFKQRRFRFLHETGLILIYGLIVGLMIKFTTSNDVADSVLVRPSNVSAFVREDPPTFVRLMMTDKENKSGMFHYKVMDRFYGANDEEADKPMEEQATFSPEVFFNILLPPIIFNAGYSLKRRHFFRNIGSIMVFAFLGTTVSCIVVGYIMYGISLLANLGISAQENLFFGALISATDPVTVLAIFQDLGVDVDLFAIVFGESALNDAVAIVLSKTIEQFTPTESADDKMFDLAAFAMALGKFLWIFFGSFGLGAVIGCMNALITKYTKLRTYPLLETSLFLLMSYLSFLTAEAASMTGIVAVLFCGIVQAHYTYNNLSDESQGRTKEFFEVLNFLSENFIFAYIGVSLFTSEAHNFKPSYILGAFGAILIGRAVHIYGFSLLLNLRRKPKIPAKHMHLLTFSGLRGAIAFALAIRNTSTEQRMILYTTTSLIVIFTVIFNGGFAFQMVEWLKIKHGVDMENVQELQPQFQPDPDTSPTSESPGSERRHNPWDKAFLPRKWYNFDTNFMKPLLTNIRPNLMETMPMFCLPIARLFTTTEQMTETSGGTGVEFEAVLESEQHPDLPNHTPASLSRSESANSQGDLGLLEERRTRPTTIKINHMNGDPI